MTQTKNEPDMSETRDDPLESDDRGPHDAPAGPRRWRPLAPRRQAEPPEPAPGAASVMAALMAQRIIARGREPRRLAELYLEENRMHGMPAMVRWAGSWWRFDSGRYRVMDDEQFRADLWRVLDRVDIERTNKRGETEWVALDVKSSLVSSVA